jgi:uncharacterized YigZ family protein
VAAPDAQADASSRPERYRIPAAEAQSEQVIKNSIFIGTVGHAPTVEAAHEFVARVRATYADANHNAWAYRMGIEPQAPFGSSDDGEPGGTAGRPMLAVLEGSGLCQIVAVGTRYFGGTKLGTGGLVRAYSGAVREALHELPTVERVLHHVAEITVDYALYGNLRYLLPKHDVITENEQFTDQVTLRIAVPHHRTGELGLLLRELTNGDILLADGWISHHYV